VTAPETLYRTPNNVYGFRKCCEAIRDNVPIEEVARRYTHLEPFGGRAWFTGRCALPDHEDKTPSFYIYPPGRFHCYGCGRGGDAVDLEFFCGDYGELWEAMIALAVEFGVELPGRTRRWHEAQGRRVTYVNWAYEVIGEELARRVFKVTVLPFIDAIIDPGEREQALERAWERWQSKSWKRIAEAVCQGDESMIVALAKQYVEAQEALK
jgi:CHC2-type zinc finger protein